MGEVRAAVAPLRVSAQVAAASGLLQLGPLAAFLLLSRRLTPDELGAYRQVLILQSLPGLLLTMGVPSALLYLLGRQDEGREQATVYRAALRWLGLSAIAGGVLAGLLVYVAGGVLGSTILRDAAGLAAIFGGLSVFTLFAGAAFVARKRPAAYLGISALHAGLLLAGTWWLAAPGDGLRGALVAACLAGCFGFGATAAALWTSPRGPLSPLGDLLRYGGPIALGSCLYLLGYQADHFVASWLLSRSDYGFYAAGAWQLPLGPIVQQAQGDVLLTKMAAHHVAERREAFWGEWQRLARPWGGLGVILFWAMFLPAGEIIRVGLGSGFEASVVPFRVYALMLPLRLLAYALPLRAAGATRWDPPAGLLFGAVSFAAGWALTPHLGLAGPASGVVLGFLAWVSFILSAARRELAAPRDFIRPARPLLAGLMWTAAAAIPSYWASAAIGAASVRLGVFWVLYAGVLALIRRYYSSAPSVLLRR